MENFLPWWISAFSLAAITLGFYFALNRPLGVSGSWARVVQWKNDRLLDAAEAPFLKQPKLFEDALMAATIQEFGEREVKLFMDSRHKNKPENTVEEPVAVASRTPWKAHLVFLLMTAVGGLIGSYIKNGGLDIQFTLGEVHTTLFGTGVASFMTLFFGGILVGFGTQFGGGCTSGHGLSGVSRLVPASIIAMLSFFGAAVVISMAVHYLG